MYILKFKEILSKIKNNIPGQTMQDTKNASE